MHAIGLSSAIFLLYVLVLLPWVAFRGARAFAAAVAPPPDGPQAARAGPLPPLQSMYLNTLVMLELLFLLAWFTARSFGYDLFALPHLGLRDLLAGAAALGGCLATIVVGRFVRTPDEYRALAMHRLLPVTSRERLLYAVISIAAGISEEAAYRGVLMSVLWYALGNPWIAVAISATAFALGHALQGWKSMAMIFAIALTMHALVWYTGTLVVAMAVHAGYDLLVPTVRRRISPAPPTSPGRTAG